MNIPFHTLVNIGDGFESENSKDNDAGVDGCEGVADRHQDDVTDTVVLGRVVTSERDQGSKGEAE